MKFETMAVLLCMMVMVISVPFINAAMNGKGSMGLIGVIPMLLFVGALLWGFSRLALREADAQLMQLLRLFDCLEAENALRDAGVQKVADLEYITSESLNMLSVSLITKAKLQDLLRYAGAPGWAKQVYEDGSADGKCKNCGMSRDEHHGKGRYCSKRYAEASEKLLKSQIPVLYKACKDGDAITIEKLAKAGADVNAEDKQGRVPLHLACHLGMHEAVAALIDAGANINAKSHKGESIMLFALQNGSVECMRLLLKAGLSTKDPCGDFSTPLHMACSKRCSDICKVLIEYGADVHAKDSSNSTPLLETGIGSAEVKLLIKHKADMMARDANGRTPLHKSSFAGTRAACVLLLEAKAQVNAKDAEGCTALHWASKMGHDEVVKALIETGKADVNCRNIDGETPLHFAKNTTVADALLKAGGDHEIKDSDGASPLDAAISNKIKDVEKLLKPLTDSSKKLK